MTKKYRIALLLLQITYIALGFGTVLIIKYTLSGNFLAVIIFAILGLYAFAKAWIIGYILEEGRMITISSATIISPTESKIAWLIRAINDVDKLLQEIHGDMAYDDLVCKKDYTVHLEAYQQGLINKLKLLLESKYYWVDEMESKTDA